MGGRRDKAKGGRGRNNWRQEQEPMPKLENSENSWAVQQQASKQDDDEAVTRRTRIILNKLTVEKFEKLSEELLLCGIETRKHVETLMREVFEKATTQHHFIEMYTDLCIKLNQKFLATNGGEDGEEEKVGFRRILLNQCQDSFHTYLKPPAGLEDLSPDDQFEAKMKYKTKMLGNMKFVGRLLCRSVLSARVIQFCTSALLDTATEETLETLSVFLSTIGPAFDKKEFKGYDELCKIFKQAERMASDSSLSPRIRCILKNVLEMRAARWQQTRPSQGPDGPKSMSEIKNKWAADNEQLARKAGGKGDKGKGGDRRYGDSTPGDRGKGGDSRYGGSTPSGASGRDRDRRDDRRDDRREDREHDRGDRNRDREAAPERAPDEWETVPRRSAKPAWGTQDRQQPVALSRNETPSTPSRSSQFTRNTPKKDRPQDRYGGEARQAATPSSTRGNAWRGADVSEDRQTKEALRREAFSMMNSLAVSFDIDEVLSQIREMKVKPASQKGLFVDMVRKAAEANAKERPILWRFIARCFSEEILQRDILVEGMQTFLDDHFQDLKCDVPQLHRIIEEEFLLQLDGTGEEASAALLDADQREAIAKRLQEDDCE